MVVRWLRGHGVATRSQPLRKPMSDIADRVKRLVAKHLDVEEVKVVPEASFIDDLGADSLDTVELMMAFEEGFDLEIGEEAGRKMRTVQNAVDYIKMRTPH
jgi:acyl carrier protein